AWARRRWCEGCGHVHGWFTLAWAGGVKDACTCMGGSRSPGLPVAAEQAHDDGVDPLAVIQQRLAPHSLGEEPSLLIDALCPRVEGKDLQFDPVQRQVGEGIVH